MLHKCYYIRKHSAQIPLKMCEYCLVKYENKCPRPQASGLMPCAAHDLIDYVCCLVTTKSTIGSTDSRFGPLGSRCVRHGLAIFLATHTEQVAQLAFLHCLTITPGPAIMLFQKLGIVEFPGPAGRGPVVDFFFS